MIRAMALRSISTIFSAVILLPAAGAGASGTNASRGFYLSADLRVSSRAARSRVHPHEQRHLRRTATSGWKGSP